MSLAAIHLREEPDALMSARPGLCGGHRATGVPTAIANLRAVRPAACVILRAVYKRPRQVEWFVGLQILALALGGVLVVVIPNEAGWEVGLLFLILVLLAYVAIKCFFPWKIWKGKSA